MTRAERLQIDAASAILDGLGIKWETRTKTKHTSIVVFDSAGGEHKFAIAGTPRDEHYAVHYAKQKCNAVVLKILQQETARRRLVHGRV